MSYHEGSKWQERMQDNRSVGGCGKHKGQPLINCPMCASDQQQQSKPLKSLQDLAIEYNLSGEELLMASNYLIAMRLTKLGIPPERLMYIAENWDRINKAVKILNHDLG